MYSSFYAKSLFIGRSFQTPFDEQAAISGEHSTHGAARIDRTLNANVIFPFDLVYFFGAFLARWS